ncbi:MAG: S41 family peptidase [Phototrophicaceae bacterium]
MRKTLFIIPIAILLLIISIPVWAIGETNDDILPAEIINDEGGPIAIVGDVTYTNAFFTLGVSEPLIVLEDQTGFVTRDKNYIIPVASQQLGQITSNFFESPFGYSLSLPLVPQAPLNDVDNDDEDDIGIMIFQVAYWTNTFGDAFLEERDLYGGGWSGAYASADVSGLVENRGEYIGGTILIYAPVEGQAFPSGFGADEMLFTEDDPLVIVPQGYTIVNMDSDVFTFDRSREPVIDLLEGEGAEADDFSDLSYSEAFLAMVEKFRNEYAFTDYYTMDWDALYSTYADRIQLAETNNDPDLFSLTLQDFLWQIPDGHISMSLTLATYEQAVFNTDGGLGLALRQLDDNRVIVSYLTNNSAADRANIEIEAEIIAIDGVPINDAISATFAYSEPFSTDHVRRLQQLRYITRYSIGTDVEITYRNPSSLREQTVTLTAESEIESFAFSSFAVDLTGYELPVQYDLIGDFLRVEITSFSDNDRLSIQLWERMLEQAIADDIPAIIIDMRNNGGGSGYLADQMAAYFFQEPLVLGNSGSYDDSLGSFYFDLDSSDIFILPPENLRYDGEVVVLVGPNCASACEFFSYNMTIQDRATIVGQYPTAGLGGGVSQFFMPDNITVQITIARAVDSDGEIHIEGIGVVPDVRVPVTIETLFAEDDVVLQSAIEYLNQILQLD